jgi:hypothetical protein
MGGKGGDECHHKHLNEDKRQLEPWDHSRLLSRWIIAFGGIRVDHSLLALHFINLNL